MSVCERERVCECVRVLKWDQDELQGTLHAREGTAGGSRSETISSLPPEHQTETQTEMKRETEACEFVLLYLGEKNVQKKKSLVCV